MPVLSDRVGTFTDSVIRRMTRINNQYNSINLSQGFPDFDPPKQLLDALARTAYAGPHQYAVTFGAQNFREALAKKTSPALHHTVDPNTEICVTCGGTEAMMAAMMTICNPGDKVMIFSPFYENYGADAILSGAEPIYIPLVPPAYEFDISLIEKGFAEGAKALILCNPSNPCGKVFRRDELEAIAALAIKYDAFVVTDEVYEHIVYAPAEHICMASLPGMFEHTITCNSLSKTYSITGWRLGYAAGPKGLMKVINKVHAYIIMCTPTMSQYGAIEALRDDALCDSDVGAMREAYDERRQYLVKALNDMGLTCFEPRGAFYVFPSIAVTGLTSQEFCERLLHEASVAVVPGDAFGESGEGHVRISYAYSMDQLQTAMGKIREFLQKNGWLKA